MPDIGDTNKLWNNMIGARSVKAVTPSDTVDLPDGVCDFLWVGGAGNVAINAEDDNTTTQVWAGVTAGKELKVRARRVKATGTTATLILACY